MKQTFPWSIPEGFAEWLDGEIKARHPRPMPTAELRSRMPVKFGSGTNWGAQHFGRMVTEAGFTIRKRRINQQSLSCVDPREGPPKSIQYGDHTYIRQDLCQRSE